MAEYEITGVEEVVAKYQIINVEVEGVPYFFETRSTETTSDVDVRGYSLRDIEPSISNELDSRDRHIEEVNSKFKANKRLARFGEIALTLNAVGESIAYEMLDKHNLLAESAMGVVAVGAVVVGELFIRTQSHKTEQELSFARSDRGRLASLLRQARPPKRPRAISSRGPGAPKYFS